KTLSVARRRPIAPEAGLGRTPSTTTSLIPNARARRVKHGCFLAPYSLALTTAASMTSQTHEALKAKIWEIANRLRGPYRPPQYRLVMLPIVVLRRFDCVLEPTKDAVLREYERLTAMGLTEEAMEK